MRLRLRGLRICVATLSLFAAVLTVLAGAPVRAAAMPPFEPDPNARGCLNFYDAHGNVQVGGGTSDAPMVAFAQAAGPARSGGGGPDNSGTLYGYLAQPNVNSALWPGEQMSAGNSFPAAAEPGSLGANRKNPTYAGAADEESIGTLETHFPHPKSDPANYQGVYQIRFVTSGQASGTDPLYWRADVQVTGNTWTQIWCTPLSPNAAGSSTAVSGAGGNQPGGSGATTSTSSLMPTAGGGSNAGTGSGVSGTASSGHGTPTSTGSGANQSSGKPAAGTKGRGRSLALLLLITLIVVIAGVLLWARARRRGPPTT